MLCSDRWLCPGLFTSVMENRPGVNNAQINQTKINPPIVEGSKTGAGLNHGKRRRFPRAPAALGSACRICMKAVSQDDERFIKGPRLCFECQPRRCSHHQSEKKSHRFLILTLRPPPTLNQATHFVCVWIQRVMRNATEKCRSLRPDSFDIIDLKAPKKDTERTFLKHSNKKNR